MAQVLMDFMQQSPATGLAVGGAIVAAAVGFTAVKALGGKADGDATPPSSGKRKKSASKKKYKKTAEVEAVSDAAPASKKEVEQEKINFEDFVADYPDTEEEEAARAEKKKLKRKLKKKKSKQAGNAPTSATSDSDAAAIKKAAAKKDAEEGWETVSYKKSKAPKSKQS
ncbi:TPA: hypothetical protein N0F65_002051 [Lagenidium giganteum]|uniref:Uncharacterized protein n=1 Tax=Lagenidium giganteum TaxID=4803 RepID=A0AAV2ZHD0_9STRA|nr:TPA: hypothetical protein N0F65_002051 [Lagenidium giganteum]